MEIELTNNDIAESYVETLELGASALEVFNKAIHNGPVRSLFPEETQQAIVRLLDETRVAGDTETILVEELRNTAFRFRKALTAIRLMAKIYDEGVSLPQRTEPYLKAYDEWRSMSNRLGSRCYNYCDRSVL